MKTLTKNTNKTTTENIYNAIQFELLNRFGKADIFLYDNNEFKVFFNNEREFNFDYKYSNSLSFNNVYKTLTKTKIKEQIRDLIKINKNIRKVKSLIK